MSDCGCEVEKTSTREEQRAVLIALILNATMFAVGTLGGIVGQSNALLADALDMLADASAYGIALLAISRTLAFKVRAARLSGIILLLLGVSVIAEAIRRAMTSAEPEGWIIVATAALSLTVNAYVLKLLMRYKSGEVHLKAAWIFTRADVIANLGVIIAGLLVIGLDSRIPDLVAGFAIGLYVVREAIEILIEARKGEREG